MRNHMRYVCTFREDLRREETLGVPVPRGRRLLDLVLLSVLLEVLLSETPSTLLDLAGSGVCSRATMAFRSDAPEGGFAFTGPRRGIFAEIACTTVSIFAMTTVKSRV